MTQTLAMDERAVPETAWVPQTLVVGVHGTPGGLHALRAACTLAERTGAAVRVVVVIEPLPMIVPEAGVGVPLGDFEAIRREDIVALVERQVREVAGERCGWQPEVFYGEPASVLARIAREADQSMIVVGRNAHGVGDRLLGFEALPRLLRLVNVPVLVVGSRFDRMPRRAVVGVDFGDTSLVAARLALLTFPEINALSLVHVKPSIQLPIGLHGEWQTRYEAGVGMAFTRFTASLRAPKAVTIERVTLTGSAARELADFAEFGRSDLIVVGTRTRGLLVRMLEGQVGAKVAHDATCSVFVVPERVSLAQEVRRAAGSDGAGQDHGDPGWERTLTEYASRNIGRRVSVEVDDPSLGAQAQVVDYVLMGADYDARTGRVEIMLGDGIDPMHHLTHGMTDIRSVDILRDEQMRDTVLRISHGRGQSLVTAKF